MQANPTVKPQWFTLAQAAETLGSTSLNVLMHVKRGLLVGEEDADGWRVEGQSLAALVQKRGETGAPTLCASGCSKTHGCKSCG